MSSGFKAAWHKGRVLIRATHDSEADVSYFNIEQDIANGDSVEQYVIDRKKGMIVLDFDKKFSSQTSLNLIARGARSIGLTRMMAMSVSAEQRLIDAAAPLQQGREERALPQLRDPQIQVSGSRRQRPGSGPVAVGRAVAAALKRANTDERGRFRIDQLLIERFGREPEPVGDIGEFQLGEQVEQGRLI